MAVQTLSANGLKVHQWINLCEILDSIIFVRFVALVTSKLFVFTIQRVFGLSLMVKSERLPMHVIVALRAVFAELTAMHILMAGQAGLLLKIWEKVFIHAMSGLHGEQCIGWCMASGAIDIGMRTLQWIPSFVVIKLKSFSEILSGMTFTTTQGIHLIVELTGVNIVVTNDTEALVGAGPVINFNFIFNMASGARNANVFTSQWKSS